MAILTKDVDVQAKQDELLKIKLENTFKLEITKYFNSVIDDFATLYASSGTIISTDEYKKSLEVLLKNHYKRCNIAFYKLTWDRLLKPVKAENNEDNTKEEILGLLLLWRLRTAPKRADLMLVTTAKDISKSIERANTELIENNEVLSNSNVAKKAKPKLKDLTNARINTIAMTETGLASEFAKQETALTMFKNNLSESQKKMWITVGDGKVRSAHMMANRQKVGIDDFYHVGGDLLKYPSDENGSIANIVNCRCASIII